MSPQPKTIDDDAAIPEDVFPRQSHSIDDILWSDPETTLRRPHVAAVSVAASESPAVPSNSAVAIPKVVFSATPSALGSDRVKCLSGDPALIRRPPASGPCVRYRLSHRTA